MQRLGSRVSRRVLLCAVGSLYGNVSRCFVAKQSYSTAFLPKYLQTSRKPAIPVEFVKWSALGFYRTSKFASGFTPLQPKPLESIIEIERAKGKSPELLAEIWDDVSYKFACDSVCVRFKNFEFIIVDMILLLFLNKNIYLLNCL